MSTIKELYAQVVDGRARQVPAQVEKALAEGIEPRVILQEGLIAPMAEVGTLFETGEYFVPEMLVSARAMKAGLTFLRPHLVDRGVEAVGRVSIGTVKGDLHDIGKSLVSMMLEGAGFEVNDLGVDVPPERFVEEVEKGAQILALSALLTTTMPALKGVIEAVEKAGHRDKVKIMVGGAPVTEHFSRHIGADGYAPDASAAVRTARSLLGK